MGAEIKIWDATSGKETMTLSGHDSSVRSILFSPDSKRIMSGSGDATIRIWDATNGEGLMVLYGHKDYIESLAISPDGSRIVSSSRDNTTKVWDADTGAELMTIPTRSACTAFSPNGMIIAGGAGERGDITLWESGPRPGANP